MSLLSKNKIVTRISIACCAAALSVSLPVYADDTQNLEQQSSALQQELSGINSELSQMATDIANVQVEMEDTANAITSTQEQLSIIQNSETKQYESMKQRIQYMYENGNSSLLEMLFSSKSIADFVNKADFIQNISAYDRNQLSELQDTITTIQDQQTKLSEQQASLQSMENDLQNKQVALNEKAAQTSTSIDTVNAQIAQIKAAQQAAAEKAAQEAAAKAQAEAAAKAQASQATDTNNSVAAETVASADTSSSEDTSSDESYSYSSGGGLTPSKGVVYFNGHRETYYSQKVLPGNGLNIPGRHVAEDGTIRDGDGYICVASNDLEQGAVVETSLGPGKVYDSGCASGTIDLYTNW